MDKYWLIRPKPSAQWEVITFNPVETESERMVYAGWEVVECEGRHVSPDWRSVRWHFAGPETSDTGQKQDA